MKYVFIIILLVSCGCSFVVDGWMVEQAVEFCSSRNRVHHIRAFAAEAVFCSNGEMEYLSNLKLQK